MSRSRDRTGRCQEHESIWKSPIHDLRRCCQERIAMDDPNGRLLRESLQDANYLKSESYDQT